MSDYGAFDESATGVGGLLGGGAGAMLGALPGIATRRPFAFGAPGAALGGLGGMLAGRALTNRQGAGAQFAQDAHALTGAGIGGGLGGLLGAGAGGLGGALLSKDPRVAAIAALLAGGAGALGGGVKGGLEGVRRFKEKNAMHNKHAHTKTAVDPGIIAMLAADAAGGAVKGSGGITNLLKGLTQPGALGEMAGTAAKSVGDHLREGFQSAQDALPTAAKYAPEAGTALGAIGGIAGGSALGSRVAKRLAELITKNKGLQDAAEFGGTMLGGNIGATLGSVGGAAAGMKAQDVIKNLLSKKSSYFQEKAMSNKEVTKLAHALVNRINNTKQAEYGAGDYLKERGAAIAGSLPGTALATGAALTGRPGLGLLANLGAMGGGFAARNYASGQGAKETAKEILYNMLGMGAGGLGGAGLGGIAGGALGALTKNPQLAALIGAGLGGTAGATAGDYMTSKSLRGGQAKEAKDGGGGYKPDPKGKPGAGEYHGAASVGGSKTDKPKVQPKAHGNGGKKQPHSDRTKQAARMAILLKAAQYNLRNKRS